MTVWTISVNGRMGDENTSFVPVTDRGFLFGDSVYEVTSTRDRTLMFWDEHVKRMGNSAAGLGLRIPFSAQDLFQKVKQTILASPVKGDVYVRTIVTRGHFADIGLEEHEGSPNLVVLVKALPQQPQRHVTEGIRLVIAREIQRNARKATDPNLKTGNYLNSVLAMREARQKGFDDAVMLNAAGKVTEGTTFNVWAVKDGTLFTSPLDAGILLGITRAQIFDICRREKIPCDERYFSADEFLAADEVFVTGSIKGIIPVGKLDDKTWPSGKRPLTEKLAALYETHCRNYAKSHSQWKI